MQSQYLTCLILVWLYRKKFRSKHTAGDIEVGEELDEEGRAFLAKGTAYAKARRQEVPTLKELQVI